MMKRRSLLLLLLFWLAAPAVAQDPTADEQDVTATDQVVDVDAQPDDTRIATRIAAIMEATGWYSAIDVRAEDGIVFIDGKTDKIEKKQWARDLAAKTTGVVAVVNRLEVEQEVTLSLDPAVREVNNLKDQILAAVPSIVLALLILPVAWYLMRMTRRAFNWFLEGRLRSPFMVDIVARLASLPIFLIGLYLVLQIAGLTQLAFSVVGGAGVLGIVIGFAFRDIAENFLASLLLSMRQPYHRGDYISVDGREGSVHSMNTRSTVLVSPDGNHIQIPNSTVFKSVIENFTAVPRRRGMITIGIGYDAAISDVQKIIGTILAEHKGVLNDPEPMVLADTLGASTVNVNIYYWFDGQAVSAVKLQSSLIRKIKQGMIDAEISMPDDAREIIFPQGVPISREIEPASATSAKPITREADAHAVDDDLSKEDKALTEQLEAPIEGSDGGDLLT